MRTIFASSPFRNAIDGDAPGLRNRRPLPLRAVRLAEHARKPR
jgi:hypothetical protein